MDLMLRFCDTKALTLYRPLSSAENFGISLNAFLPAPVVVLERRPGGPEELPQLDTRFGQGLLEQLHPIRKGRIRLQQARSRWCMQQ